MKIGAVELQNGLLHPKVNFHVAGFGQEIESFSGTLDTGFTGWVALPEAEIEKLGLEFSHTDILTLADSGNVQAPLYVGEVLLVDSWLRVFVVGIGLVPLVGTGLVRNARLTVDLIPNGTIDYTALS